ncbi:TPA: TIGR01440 family protein [Streptococcus pyogenes]|nr:TIGR01440 family protein [Streptococcus pyogenes]
MLNNLEKQTREIVIDVVERSAIQPGNLFVLGLSSSEILGSRIGKQSSLEVGQIVVEVVLDELNKRGVHLAVQGCEHVNRALVVERHVAESKLLEIVNVVPKLHAGGSAQMAAFQFMSDPVEVEEVIAHAGLDIGDTAIGMHIKRVQIPLIPCQRELGGAHVTALASRPKLIGGARADYNMDIIRKS